LFYKNCVFCDGSTSCFVELRAEGRRMLGMLKRHEVEILLKAGHPKTEVARLAGVVAQFESTALRIVSETWVILLL
jgi:hypothetical protein